MMMMIDDVGGDRVDRHDEDKICLILYTIMVDDDL